MKKLGIIAAKGSLVKRLIEYCKEKHEFFVVAIEGETNLSLLDDIDHVVISVGEIGKAVEAMKKAKVEQVILIGGLAKPNLLNLKVDMMGAKLLARITKNKLFGADNILSIIAKFLEEHCFEVIAVQDILKDLVVKPGIFTKIKPSEQDKNDIELGIKILHQMSALDIGQAVIIENGLVLGMEAIEGTDQLINRCGSLKRGQNREGVLVKMAKENQELRLDLPTIGINTIINLHDNGFKGIAIQAQKSLFLDQEQVIEYANKNNMFIIAC